MKKVSFLKRILETGVAGFEPTTFWIIIKYSNHWIKLPWIIVSILYFDYSWKFIDKKLLKKYVALPVELIPNKNGMMDLNHRPTDYKSAFDFVSNLIRN